MGDDIIHDQDGISSAAFGSRYLSRFLIRRSPTPVPAKVAQTPAPVCSVHWCFILCAVAYVAFCGAFCGTNPPYAP